jgi:hypothetical protein
MGAPEIGAFLQHVAQTSGPQAVVDQLTDAHAALAFVY